MRFQRKLPELQIEALDQQYISGVLVFEVPRNSSRPLLRVRKVIPSMTVGKSRAVIGAQLRLAALWDGRLRGNIKRLSLAHNARLGLWLGKTQRRHADSRQGRN